MPGKVFTNADVQRMLGRSPLPAEQEPVGMKMPPLGYQGVNPATSGETDRILAGAKAALQRAYGMGDQSAIASVPDRLQQLEQDQTQSTTQNQNWGKLTTATKGLSNVGLGAGIAGMVPSPASPFLEAASLPMMVPDILRHALLPNQDETRLGGVAEGALLGGLSQGGRAISALRSGGKSLAPLADHIPTTAWGKLAEANSIQRATRVPGEALTDQISREVGGAASSMPVEAPTPALEALKKPRATLGRAAREAAYSGPDRRVDPSGKLPLGMTDRRMDELIKNFGFGR